MQGYRNQQSTGEGRQDGHVKVQDPPWKGTFNSYQLNWTHDVCYIKTDRLNDFVQGEAKYYLEAPTRFVKRCSYVEPGKRNGWLSYAQFFCEFGTSDRGKKSLSSSQFIQDPATKPKSGPGSRDRLDHDNQHKGCLCRFSAIEQEPSDSIPPNTTKLIFRHRLHVGKDGRPCHGTANPRSVGLPSQMAHSLSAETR
jgi:hypothetical protein